MERVFIRTDSYEYCGIFLEDKVLNYSTGVDPKSSQYWLRLSTNYYIQ